MIFYFIPTGQNNAFLLLAEPGTFFITRSNSKGLFKERRGRITGNKEKEEGERKNQPHTAHYLNITHFSSPS